MHVFSSIWTASAMRTQVPRVKPVQALIPTLEALGIQPPDELAALYRTVTNWAHAKGLHIDTISLRHAHLQLYTDPINATYLNAGREELLDHLFIHHTGTVENLSIRSRNTPPSRG